MHKFISNSVNKFKHFNLSSWITEKTYQNVDSCCSIHTVSCSNAKSPYRKAGKVVNFDEMVTTRRAQAQRSILVQVQSDKSYSELHKYCSQYGNIVGAHHYRAIPTNDHILVEYSSLVEAQEAIKDCTFEDATGRCVQSPFLWFRAAQKRGVVKDSSVFNGNLTVTDGCPTIVYKEINEIMLGAESLSDQMAILFRSTTINDLGTRLRFFAARQIEESISGIFPSAKACIFGSSVNGMGKLGCDLDMVLQLHSLDSDPDTTKRLLFHTKQSMTCGKAQVQKSLETFSQTMHLFLPGIENVRQILHAKVPIIKYKHQLLDLDVDLSLSNMSGLYMTEIFYGFSQIDNRVQPLVYAIRRWAQTTGVTHSGPGAWISNFSLTCLVIFYLQQLQKPVLPTIDSLVQQARPQDKRISEEEGVLCTFLRDLNVLKFAKKNTDSLGELLMGFFEYYCQIDFAISAFSLNDAQLHTKPNESALYVINPLQQTLNVTRNVSAEECERFRIGVRNAAWLLESTGNRANGDTWGLLNVFRDSEKPVIKANKFFETRMVSLENVLDAKNGKGEKDTNHEKIKSTNSRVKKAVTRIKKYKRIVMDVMSSNGKKR